MHLENKKDSISVIIAAAGNSNRLQKNTSKLFLELYGKPLLFYSLEKFSELENINEIIVVTNDIEKTNDLLLNFENTKNIKITTVSGSNTRAGSVYNGFQALTKTDFVLIHDVARPLFNLNDVIACIKKAFEVNAAILAVPLVDTIKKGITQSSETMVEKTLDRKNLFQIQTPQVFKYELLSTIYKKYKSNNLEDNFTDEASLLEYFGEKVFLVIGDRRNIKITYPEDLHVAESIIETYISRYMRS